MKDYQVFLKWKYAYDANRRVLPTAYVVNLTVPLNRTLVIVPSAAETWLFQVDITYVIEHVEFSPLRSWN